MRRSVFVAAVLVLAALTATAPAASAQNVSGSLEVASKNTTDSDFQNATLTNMSIVGSGDSASVSTANTIESFEDGDIDEYNLVDGSSSMYSINSDAPVFDGAQSFKADTGGSEIEFYSSTAESSLSPGSQFSYSVQLDDSDDYVGAAFAVQDATAQAGSGVGGYAAYVDAAQSTLNIARMESGFNQLDSTPVTWPTGEEIAVKVTWGANGQITATAYDSNGDEIATVQATDTTYNGGGVGFRIGSNSVGGPIVVDGDGSVAASGTYQSSHTISGAEQAFANLTLQDAEATITVEEDTGGAWSQVAQTTVSTSGNHTLDISSASASDLRTVVDFSSSGSAPVAKLHDEGILFNASAPTIDDGSASPTGNLQQANQTLSLNASDADFGLAQGDSVNVTFEAKAPDESSFSAVGSDTITANGTANTSLTADVGGTWEWRATATDSYGESGASQTFSFSAPGSLELRNASAANQLLDGPNASAEVTFFASSGIYTRTTANGTIPFTGLPNDERFIVRVDIDGYYQRTVIIDSLYQQEAVYILAESEPSAEIVWELDDRSGTFAGNDPTLTVEAPITRDFDGDGTNETEYQVIAGQEFSATSSAVMDLRTGERLRLYVSNDDDDRRFVGAYTPTADSLEPIVIKGIRFSRDSRESYSTQVSISNPDDAKRELTWAFDDPANATTDLEVRVEYRSNGTAVYTDTADGPLGSYAADVTLQNGSTYLVNWTATRNGETIGQTRPVAGNDLGVNIPLDSQWLGTIGMVFVAFVGTLAGREYRSHMALAMVAMAGVLMLLQAVSIWVPLWWLGLTIAAGAHLNYIQNQP